MLNPPQDRRVRQVNAPLAHHGHQIAIAELETQIPADAEHHDLLVKMAALEQFFYRNESRHLSIIPRVHRVCTRALSSSSPWPLSSFPSQGTGEGDHPAFAA